MVIKLIVEFLLVIRIFEYSSMMVLKMLWGNKIYEFKFCYLVK